MTNVGPRQFSWMCVRNLYLFIGPAMLQAVSCHPFTTEARVHPQASMCGIFGGQSGSGRGISFENFGFPLLVSFHPRFILLFIHPLLTLYNPSK